MVSVVGFLALFVTVLLASTANAQCPMYAEWTSTSPCDYICGVPCDFKGVKNICICMEGYLKDPSTGQCVPENQCSIAPDVPVLRGGGDPPFSFSCFS